MNVAKWVGVALVKVSSAERKKKKRMEYVHGRSVDARVAVGLEPAKMMLLLWVEQKQSAARASVDRCVASRFLL